MSIINMLRDYDIRSKITKYGGVVFRSKEEARWAVFFDSLGVKYEYEPFYSEVETGCISVNYLPDFYLPKQEMFIEVKPGKPFGIENIKAAAWCKDVSEIVVLFNLNPPTDKLENGWLFFYPNISKVTMIMKSYWWGECPKCGHVDIAEYASITSCECFDANYYNELYEKEEISGKNFRQRFSRSKRLMKAYSTAKNYKFLFKKNIISPKIKYQSSLF